MQVEGQGTFWLRRKPQGHKVPFFPTGPVPWLVAAMLLAILLQALLPAELCLAHGKIYFIPILLAGRFGWRLALVVLALTSVVFGVHVITAGDQLPVMRTEQLSDIISFWIVGLLSSWLFERIRRTSEENQRMGSELQLARKIQESMQPNPWPFGAEIEFAGCSRPAREVGGDLFDYFAIGENHVGVIVADVIGKGIPAALYTIVCRSALKSLALGGDNPGRCLEGLNSLLLLNENAFVTVFFAILDLRTGQAVYANAGHHPPVLVGAAGPRVVDCEPGLPLGIFPFAFAEESLHLKLGEGLVLYTDGIVESRTSSGEEFGAERLLSALSAAEELTAPVLIQAIFDSMALCGCTQADDLTVVALVWKGVR